MRLRLLLLLVLTLLLAMLLLSACGGTEAPATTPSVTTAPVATVSTSGGPTAEVTTTAPVTTATPTTVPPVTSAPLPESQNPITEIKTTRGGIKMTFKDGTTVNLGTAPLREGYNSVTCVGYSLNDGTLTLTLRDSAATNIANRFLETAPDDLTVRLCESNGSLLWALADDGPFAELCPVTADGSILARLSEATGFGSTVAPPEQSMTFMVAGNALRLRAYNWVQEGYDFCTTLELHSAASNGNLMFIRFDVIPSGEEEIAPTANTLFKGASDEIPSIHMNGSFISARHGYYLISAVPNAAGLTEEDIGIVFTRKSDNQQYVLVKALAGSLWFCPFDDDAMESGDFGRYSFGTNGLLEDGDILMAESTLSSKKTSLTVAANATLNQFYVATNHAVQHAYLNGTHEVDLTKDGTYNAEFVDIYEAYDVIYLPEMLTYLMDNAGYNDNDTHHNEGLVSSYLSYIHTHRFHKNGSYTVYQTVEIHKELRNVYYYGVMSMPFSGSEQYVYAPGSTNVGTPTLQTNVTVEAKGEASIRSFYQLTDAVGTKGINVGYYPYFGIATDESRTAALGNKANVSAGQWYSSRKMYPYLFMNHDMKTGEEISFIGYHVPTVKLSDDFFAVSWYFVGDEIYLSLHTDAAADRQFVALPNSDYLTGLTVTVDECSDGVTVHSGTVTESGIEISTEGAGYVTVKLTHP